MSKIRPYDHQITSGGTSSVLSSLYRVILKQLGIKETRFGVMLDRYVVKGHKAGIIKDPSSKRGNLYIELMQDTMTWSVFIKGLHFLAIEAIEATIVLYVPDQEPTIHTKSATLGAKGEVPSDQSADTLLARMFSTIRHERNISLLDYSRLMNLYLSKSTAGTSITDLSSRRGGLTKELSRPRLTWNVFVKGLVLLNVVKFDFMVTITHASGKKTSHGRTVILEETNGGCD